MLDAIIGATSSAEEALSRQLRIFARPALLGAASEADMPYF